MLSVTVVLTWCSQMCWSPWAILSPEGLVLEQEGLMGMGDCFQG